MIVKHSDDFSNYFSLLKNDLSIPQTKHALDLSSAIIASKGKKTISELNRNFLRDINRSNRTRFLIQSPWNENLLNESRIKNSLTEISKQASLKPGSPIFLSIDDTLVSKTCKRNKIEGLSKQFSHVTGKFEWCHPLVSMQIKHGTLSIPLDFKIYTNKEFCTQNNTEFQSKNDLALQLMEHVSFSELNPMYLLMDSWYSSANLIMKVLAKGIHSITPLKSNRIIYPDGIGVKIKAFAESLDLNDFNLVTVKGNDYYTFRYEGHLKDIPNGIVLISCKVKNGKILDSMYILSTDIELSSEKIIEYYLNRWDIEVSFRYQKESLGLDHCQMRSLKGLKRFWILIYLVHNFLTLKLLKLQESTLGKIIQFEKIEALENMIFYICKLKESGCETTEIIKNFTKRIA